MRRREHRRFSVVFMLALSASMMWSQWASASYMAQPPRREARIKAAYIYNFVKFVTWPDQAGAAMPSKAQTGVMAVSALPVYVCAYGEHPLDGALAAIEGKSIGQRVIKVVVGDPDPKRQSCDVIYFSDLGRTVESYAFSILRHKAVLTISDAQGFESRGGIIEFVQSGPKIGFSINAKSAQENGLQISSKLLMLSVHGGR